VHGDDRASTNSVTKRRPRIGPRVASCTSRCGGCWSGRPDRAWALIARLAGQNFVPSPLQTLAAAVQVSPRSVPRAALSSIYVPDRLSAVDRVCGSTRPADGRVPRCRRRARTLYGRAECDAAVSFIPLIIIFSARLRSEICVVFLGAMIPILVNTYTGVLNSDGDLIEMARSAGATDMQIFRRSCYRRDAYIIAGMRWERRSP